MRFDELRASLAESSGFNAKEIQDQFKGSDDFTFFKFDRSFKPVRHFGGDWQYQIRIEIDKKVLEVSGGTLFDPKVIELLTKFLQALPEVGHYLVKIDTDQPHKKLKDVVKQGVLKIDQVPFFYHGTSEATWQKIREFGLSPRVMSQAQSAYGKFSNANESNPDLVYLTTEDSMRIARFAARDAARLTKSDPVVLKIDAKGVNVDRLEPDEDSKETTWEGSLKAMGSVGYRGKITPQHISLYKKI